MRTLKRFRLWSHWQLILITVVLFGFTVSRPCPAQSLLPVPSRIRSWQPRLAQSSQAPALAVILSQIALQYDPQMSESDRERDFRAKIAKAQQLTGIRRLKVLRDRSLQLIRAHGGVISWEFLRNLRWPHGDRAGVTLTVPVWVPRQAQRVTTYAAFVKKWQAVAHQLPRPCGEVWFVADLQHINDKPRYRAATLSFEVNSLLAPFAALLLEYIFREGVYQPEKRLPLLVIRGGEDTYAASAYSGPVSAECLSFADEEGASLECRVCRNCYASLAEIHHGRHARASNHRLGCALDLNDFNFKGAVDGTPNPISRALRQFNRDAMHRLDARNLPAWVYRAARQIGYRLPQEWYYFGYYTDWPHFDCGNR